MKYKARKYWDFNSKIYCSLAVFLIKQIYNSRGWPCHTHSMCYGVTCPRGMCQQRSGQGTGRGPPDRGGPHCRHQHRARDLRTENHPSRTHQASHDGQTHTTNAKMHAQAHQQQFSAEIARKPREIALVLTGALAATLSTVGRPPFWATVTSPAFKDLGDLAGLSAARRPGGGRRAAHGRPGAQHCSGTHCARAHTARAWECVWMRVTVVRHALERRAKRRRRRVQSYLEPINRKLETGRYFAPRFD